MAMAEPATLAAAVAMIDSALPEIMPGANDEDGLPVLKTVAAAPANVAPACKAGNNTAYLIDGCQGGGGAERVKPLIRMPAGD
jgi:hypothetical protein